MRQQRGITLIEILLVAVIIAAGIVGAFIFAANTRVSAAVEREQKEVAAIVRAVEGAFTFLPNFGALGTEGATYLRDNVPGSGLRYGVDGTRATLITTLGGGNATVDLAAARVDAPNGTPGIPNNGFTLTYRGAKPAECVGLVGATSARTTRIDLLPSDSGAGQLVASNGRVSADKGLIARLCGEGATVRLSFAPARAIASSPASAAPPSARCNPVRERQLSACPTGQAGSITQERVGTCTGANNSLLYTAWNTIETNCVDTGDVPPDQTPDALPPACGLSVITRAQNCPIGQVGQIVQQRTIDTCRGITPAWEEVSNSCQAPATGCTPSFDRITRPVACPNAGGQQVQELTRTSACIAGVEVWPEWSAPNTISSICQASCVDGRNCCVPQREARPIPDVCPAGTWGDLQRMEERYLGCANASTQAASWTAWQTFRDEGVCRACPADFTETERGRFIERTSTCPAGQSGSITRRVEQVRTRVRSHACPAGTTTLPEASYTAWSEYRDVDAGVEIANTCAASSACATGSVSGFAGWNVQGWPRENNVQYDRNDYTIGQHALPAACGVVAGSRGNYSVNQRPKPWEPRCDCNASLNGQSFDYVVGEWGALETDYRATCNFPARQLLTFSVQRMSANGAGASAVVSATNDMGDTETHTLSCTSMTNSGTFLFCDSQDYETSQGRRQLVLGQRHGGQLGLFDGSFRDVNTTSGSYAACLAPPPPPPSGACYTTTRGGSGVLDTHDAYYRVQWDINGEPAGSCESSRSEHGPTGFDRCRGGRNGVLDLAQWAAVARTGDAYTTSGSQTGWGGSAHEFWGWDEYTYIKTRDGCGAQTADTCSIPANTTFNWTVGGNACSFTQTSALSVPTGMNFIAQDSTPPSTGTAEFACAPGRAFEETDLGGVGNSAPWQCQMPATTSDERFAEYQAFCASHPSGTNEEFDWCEHSATHTYYGRTRITCQASTPQMRMTPQPGATCSAVPTTSSGNYEVISESCASETMQSVPPLDVQARAACQDMPVGTQRGSFHHFPQHQIGCYADVVCR